MSTHPQRFRLSSSLRARPENVWQHAASLAGVNQELWPLHMSGPDGALVDGNLPLGQPLFRSVVSLLRVIVLDLHEFKLLDVDTGRGFHECSRSLTERRWEHIRTIAPEPGGCSVTDDLEFEPRVLPSVVAPLIRHIFTRRHAFLRRKFGELVAR